jgi:cathepsin E
MICDPIHGLVIKLASLGTLSPETSSLIPTVTDNLFSLGLIDANEIGISFEPTNSVEIVNGEITWGRSRLSWTVTILTGVCFRWN